MLYSLKKYYKLNYYYIQNAHNFSFIIMIYLSNLRANKCNLKIEIEYIVCNNGGAIFHISII